MLILFFKKNKKHNLNILLILQKLFKRFRTLGIIFKYNTVHSHVSGSLYIVFPVI